MPGNTNALLAPVVLFVYNRPWHALQTLEALMQNEEAKDSILYIYADGPKQGASIDDLEKIKKTREVIRQKKWCGEVHLIESDINKGLANSVISGTSEIVNKYGSVITLEDDVVCSIFFLEYMNKALALYQFDEKVWMISGYFWPVTQSNFRNYSFFLPVSTTQAWATWKRVWNKFDLEANGYEILKKSKRLKRKFNLEGSYDFANTLFAQIEGEKNNSWAIKFWWSMFKNRGLILFPDKSLIKNIGWDGSGENCSVSNQYEDKNWQRNYQIRNYPYKVKPDRKKFALVKSFHSQLIWKPKTTWKQVLIKYTAIFFNKVHMNFKKLMARKIKPIQDMIEPRERMRLQHLERYQHTQTTLFSHKIEVPDAASFLSSLTEIFIDEIYRFESKKNSPVIIDCGANIGLATIYFKQNFPNAKIIAYEPDPVLFHALETNLESFGLSDIHSLNEAVSNRDGSVYFNCEGGHSGMVTDKSNNIKVISVKAARLKNILQQHEKIEFLKIDIEGHESIVIPDIADELKKVNYLFLEYHSFIDKDQEIGSLLNILKTAGFRFYLKESFPKKFPFIDREIFLKLDCLVNIFCYRN